MFVYNSVVSEAGLTPIPLYHVGEERVRRQATYGYDDLQSQA